MVESGLNCDQLTEAERELAAAISACVLEADLEIAGAVIQPYRASDIALQVIARLREQNRR